VFRSLFKPRTSNAEALALAVHAAARQPAFYTTLSVPDSFDGRFELLVLHAQLVIRRLRIDDKAGAELAQRLFDKLTGHFDEALRAIGVGDMGVGKRIKAMTSAFYGRLSAYDTGLDAEDSDALREALRRNLYGTVPGIDADTLDAAIAYVLAADQQLAERNFAEMEAGEGLFPDATAFRPGDVPGDAANVGKV
jgi:cytochrome b pre-mRNA-processing protein 3